MLKRVGSIIIAMLLVFVFVFGAFASEAHAATTGFVNQNGTWVFMRNGSVDKSFVGFAQRPDDNKWYFARGGKMDLTYTGIAPSTANNGKLYYANKGVLDWSYTGLVKYNGKHYAVVKGQVDLTCTGLIQNTTNKNWHYVKNGIYDTTYTGITPCVVNDKLYFVTKGNYNNKYTGLVKYGDKYYAVRNGIVDFNYTGLSQNTSNKNWHYVKNGVYDKNYTGLVKYGDKHYAVKNGKVDFSFTGVVKNNNNGNWHYVKNGIYDKTYTGIGKHILNGSLLYVQGGYFDNKYSGLVKYSGKHYAVVNGKVDYTFTGITQNRTNGNWHYVKNGIYNTTYTGLAECPEDGKLYYVSGGKIDKTFSGTKKINNVTYSINKGVASASKILEVTGFAVKKPGDGSTNLEVTLKNVSSETIGCPTAYIHLYDKNNKLLTDKLKFQAMIALLPGQSVTIEADEYEITNYVAKGATSFTIRHEGWVERSNTIWLRVWNAPENIPLNKSLNKILKTPTRSSNNSIDGAKTVSFGKDPKLAISGLKFDKIGSHPTVNITVKNNTGKTITDLNLYTAMLDSKGNIIDWFMFNGNTLKAGETTTLSTTPPNKWDQIAYFTTSYYSYDIGSSHNEWYLPTIPKAAKK